MSRTLGTFWAGDRLGQLELMCLHSMLRHGHPVDVYSYAPIANLPEGVRARDASEILPTDRILYYKDSQKPTAALHSNLFRYALLAQTDSLWVDLDIFVLKPLEFHSEHIFGLERPDSVNTAVLGFPQDSPALKQLCRFTPTMRGLPPQIRGFKRLRRMVKTFGRGKPIEEWPWGSTGPIALSLYLRESGEWRHALPIEAFYPVAFENSRLFVEPGKLSEADFGAETYAVHLWASSLRRTLRLEFNDEIPQGSFIANEIEHARRGGISL